MKMMKRIEDIDAWVSSRELASIIWKESHQTSFNKDYSLKDQINRATGSMMDNIAEGYGRGGNKEFIHFLSIARGSAQEVKSQLYRAFDRGHLDKETFAELLQGCNQATIKIHALLKKIQTSTYKGSKFYKTSSSTNKLKEPDVIYYYE